MYPERMRKNLELSQGLVYSQQVLLALVERGMARETAYALVQRQAMAAWDTGGAFFDLLAADEEVTALLPAAELRGFFDPDFYLREVDTTFARLGL